MLSFVFGFFVFWCFLLFFCSFVTGDQIVEEVLGGGSWFSFEYLVCWDVLSSIFGFMLLCCGVLALFYCGHYYVVLSNCWGLLWMMFLFLCVMVFLSCSGSVVLTLILWEYLGFVSFLLILYYSSMGCLRASVITLVSSRFGDVGLFVVFGLLINDFKFWGCMVGLSLFLIVSTKSACYPFVSWLLEAMRAPTPVSSLVHSSTLVTAGVWFLLRYGGVVNGSWLWSVYLVSGLTILLSGVCACCEMDYKKIVAFSTCNNVSWCILYLVCGDALLCVFQLLLHGLCKAFLFMVVGDLMISSGLSQSVVNFYSPLRGGWYCSFLQLTLVCCLCGLPFLGVFFTKHRFFVACLYSLSFWFFCFLMVGLFLSSVYSFRFVSLVLGFGGGSNEGVLVSFSCLGGYLFLLVLVDYLLCGWLEEMAVFSCWLGCVVLVVQVVGCVIGFFLCVGGSRSLGLSANLVFGCDVFVKLCYCAYWGLTRVCGLFLYRFEVCALSLVKVFSGVNYHLCYGLWSSVGWLVVGVSLVMLSLSFG